MELEVLEVFCLNLSPLTIAVVFVYIVCVCVFISPESLSGPGPHDKPVWYGSCTYVGLFESFKLFFSGHH